MLRFAFFVDGSYLFGSLKGMGIEVEDYQSFFNYLYRAAEQQWRTSVSAGQGTDTVLQRVYWYQVGFIDDWDLAGPQSQAYLRERFDENKAVKAGYMATAGKAMAGQ